MRCDQLLKKCGREDFWVSIPAGFSDALRPEFTFFPDALMMFQSLLGFLMRCDDMCINNNRYTYKFQSLLGFLMRCDVTGLLGI